MELSWQGANIKDLKKVIRHISTVDLKCVAFFIANLGAYQLK